MPDDKQTPDPESELRDYGAWARHKGLADPALLALAATAAGWGAEDITEAAFEAGIEAARQIEAAREARKDARPFEEWALAQGRARWGKVWDEQAKAMVDAIVLDPMVQGMAYNEKWVRERQVTKAEFDQALAKFAGEKWG